MLPVHHNISPLWKESLTALRISLQFIVIAVTSIISGAFPYTYRGFYMTVNGWRVCGPSYQRHGEIGLPKRLTRRRDDDDANDGNIRAYSRQGRRLYFVDLYPFNLTRQTRRTEQGVPYLCDLRGH
jgi:hypothetical protein